MTTTKHTCNPNRPGMPLPFGKRGADCERCDELANGAPAREGWGSNAKRNAEDDRRENEFRAHNRALGLCICGKPRHDFCTYGEW